MNKMKIVTKVTEVVVSMSTSAVVSNAIKATTPVNVSPVMRVGVFIGSVVIGSMVGDTSAKYITGTIDKTVADVKTAVEEAKAPENESN